MEKPFYSAKMYMCYSRVNYYEGITTGKKIIDKLVKIQVVNLSCMP